MLRRIMPKGRKLKVCVVGAGVAGMRCAQILGENGVDVTVLEARDRTGGRVGRSPCYEYLPLSQVNRYRCIKLC